MDNIGYRYDKNLGCLVLSVLADQIPAGRELTISYSVKRAPELLFLSYGFACRCGACGGVDEGEFVDPPDQW